MKSPNQDFQSVLSARTAFLQSNDIELDNTTLVRVAYDATDFCRFLTLSDANRGDGITHPASIVADALVVTKPGHALFLPLADCIGAVIHDPIQNILMVSHLGRHNLEQVGGTKCIEYLIKQHGVDPKKLTVWLSPAAGKDSYPLYAFDNRSLHEIATEQLMKAGVPAKNLTVSLIDSATDTNYYSHSQFLHGNRQTDGRFAIVAIMN